MCHVDPIHKHKSPRCIHNRKFVGCSRMLTQQISLDRQNHNAYANRSFVLSRKCDWDSALHNALQVRATHHHYLAVDLPDSVSQHSGILARLCLQRHCSLRKIGIQRSDKCIRPCIHVYSPRFDHDSASDSPGQGMPILIRIFLTSSPYQAIALFNANRQEESIQCIKELANICPT